MRKREDCSNVGGDNGGEERQTAVGGERRKMLVVVRRKLFKEGRGRLSKNLWFIIRLSLKYKKKGLVGFEHATSGQNSTNLEGNNQRAAARIYDFL